MSKQTYIDDLNTVSKALDKRLKDARRKFESAGIAEKVNALKEIAWLETRQKDLAERLKEAEAKHAEDWAEWHKGLKKDFDGVHDTLERLIMKYA